MSDFGWDPSLYLGFRKERSQPAVDLVNRLRDLRPERIVDLGCGPGNSTAVLAATFPEAEVLGIDASPEMVDTATDAHPELRFEVMDARDIPDGWDLIFSNACLQWLPDHRHLIPSLMSRLDDCGTLAVQMPVNEDEPLIRICDSVASDGCWHYRCGKPSRETHLTVEEYYSVLEGCASSFDVWETRYLHPLPGHRALLDWVRGTRIRPYTDALTDAEAELFEGRVLAEAEKAYPVMPDGNVLLGYRRLFFTATRRCLTRPRRG